MEDNQAKPQAIQRLSHTHDAMVDLLLARPEITLTEVAAHFGYTVPWVSRIVASDAFQAAYAKRRTEISDPILRERYALNFNSVLLRSQELLLEKLGKPANEVPDGLVIRAFDVSARAAGHGSKTAVQVNVDVSAHLDALASNLREMQRDAKEGVTIDVEPSEPEDPDDA